MSSPLPIASEHEGPPETGGHARTFRRILVRTAVGICLAPLPLVFVLVRDLSWPFEYVVAAVLGAMIASSVLIEELTPERRDLRVAGLAGAGLAIPSALILTAAWARAWMMGGPVGAYRFATAGTTDPVAWLPLAVVSLLFGILMTTVGAARALDGNGRRVGVACAIVITALAGGVTLLLLEPARRVYASWLIMTGSAWGAGGVVLVAGALALGDRHAKGAAPSSVDRTGTRNAVAILAVLVALFVACAVRLEKQHDAVRRAKRAGRRLLGLVMLQYGCRYEHLAGKKELPPRFLTLEELEAALPELPATKKEFGYVFEMAPDKDDPARRFMAVANPIVAGSGPSLCVDETLLPTRKSYRSEPSNCLVLPATEVFAVATQVRAESRLQDYRSHAAVQRLDVGYNELQFSWTSEGRVSTWHPWQFDDTDEIWYHDSSMGE